MATVVILIILVFCRFSFWACTAFEAQFSELPNLNLKSGVTVNFTICKDSLDYCCETSFWKLSVSCKKIYLLILILFFDVCLKQEILVPEASEFDHWEPEGALSSGPVTAIIPTWRSLTTLDMSHNGISQIDDSVVRILGSIGKTFFMFGKKSTASTMEY